MDPAGWSHALFAVLLGALGVLTLWRLLRWQRQAMRRRPPLAPGWHPLVGHTPLFARHDKAHRHNGELVLRMAQEAGSKLMCIDAIAITIATVMQPDLLRELGGYPKHRMYTLLSPVLGDQSMIINNGAAWAQARKAFAPAFAWSNLKAMLPVFTAAAQRSADVLRAAAAAGDVVRMHDHTMRVTLSTILETLLGQRLDFAGKDARHPFLVLLEEQLGEVAWIAKRADLAFLYYTPWAAAKRARLKAKTNAILEPMIRRCMALAAGSGDAGGAGVVSTGGSALAGPVQQQVDRAGSAELMLVTALRAAADSGNPMSLEFCTSQVMTLVFAGHDTTATLLSWAVYYLCHHPDVEAQLVGELAAVMGSGAQAEAAQPPSLDQLCQMPVLNAVIKEVLRLRPPAFTFRQAPHKASLGAYDIDGLAVEVNFYAMHRDPDVWGADADEFRPSRWLDEAYTSALHPLAWSPFSRGVRDCIGQQFALLEARAVLAELYRQFTFAYAGRHEERNLRTLTDKPLMGVPVCVHFR